MVEQILWPARQVMQFDVFRVDAKIAVQRCEYLAKVNRTLNGLTTKPVRCANDLPGFHPTASEQATANTWPVVSASVFVDSRRTSEFTPGDN